MTRMTGPDCVVMCNLINTHTHTHTHTVGPLVDSNHHSSNERKLGSYSSQCCTFLRTHTSADPIRLLYIPLALPSTLSLPSGSAPSGRLTVGVPPRALRLAGIFLRRKKRYAGVVGTRTDCVLKGEGGVLTTPLLQYCTLDGLMVARLSGLDEVAMGAGKRGAY